MILRNFLGLRCYVTCYVDGTRKKKKHIFSPIWQDIFYFNLASHYQQINPQLIYRHTTLFICVVRPVILQVNVMLQLLWLCAHETSFGQSNPAALKWGDIHICKTSYSVFCYVKLLLVHVIAVCNVILVLYYIELAFIFVSSAFILILV